MNHIARDKAISYKPECQSLFFSSFATLGKLRAEVAGEKTRKIKPDTIVDMAVCHPLSNYLEVLIYRK